MLRATLKTPLLSPLLSKSLALLFGYLFIDDTIYWVWAHFSTTSTETMEDKIKRLLREEVRQTMEQEAAGE